MSSRDSQDTQAQASQDDVATLYSWANLAGAKYRDFSASRREVRSQARQRITGQAQHIAAPEVEAIEPEMHGALSGAYDEPLEQTPIRTPAATGEERRTGEEYHEEPADPGPRRGFLETALQESMAPVAVPSAPHSVPDPSIHRPSAVEAAAPGLTVPSPNSLVPDRTTARWAALKGVFDPARDQRQPAAISFSRVAAPVVAIFSLAGGVGKSSLTATLGRILAARGERVLLVDATPYGTLPFYYGASELRPGAVRTFSGEGIEAPIQMLSLEAELPGSRADHGWLGDLLQQHGANADRILIDMGTASKALAQAVLGLAPTVIVPVVPDMSSMVGLQAVKSFFESPETALTPVQPYYLLNRFDAGAPMHEDIRDLLREQFGDRMVPFELRASAEISEALAEGVTLADYAPDSAVNEDYAAIAEWVRQRATIRRKSRGVRWSEQ